jgi:ADP-heptose:LPS heptosyltransferase
VPTRVKPARVLVLRALKLGDFLTAVPAYRAIRRAFPAARIALAAPREFAPLAALLDGALDEVVDARELEPLPKRVHDADLGIDLHGKGPECHRVLLAARPRRLIAFRHPDVPESASGAAHDAAEHEVARWCRMLAHSGIPADPHDLFLEPAAVPVRAELRGATLVHPGAASEARCWPIERWISVVRAERRRGRRVVLTGSPTEVERVQAIASAAGLSSDAVYAGRTTLLEIAGLVAGAGRVVCGDTGVAHLATAFRTPSVVLFGPTPPALWGPPPDARHRVLWAGKTGDPHAARIDAGLLAISVEQVLGALYALPAA